jgi:hypothetical protein
MFFVFTVVILEFLISKKVYSYFAGPPILIIATCYLYVGLAGFLSNKNLSSELQSNFRLKLPPAEAHQTLKIYLLSVISLLVGYSLRGSKKNLERDRISTEQTQNLSRLFEITGSKKIYVTIFFLVTNLSYALAFGINNLILREEYISVDSNITNNFFLSLNNVINLIGFLAIGWISVQATGFHKFAVFFTFLLSLVIYFSDGSRTFGLGVLLFFVGRLVEERSRTNMMLLVFSLPIANLFTNIIVSFRNGPQHGLIGHLSQILSYNFKNSGSYFESTLPSSSFAITGHTAVIANQIPMQNFFIEMNPLPGGLTGWYFIAPSMRFNYYTPYTTIGELYNYGPFLLFSFFALLGFTSSRYLLFRSSKFSLGSNVLEQVNVGSLFLFALLALQYNLRSSMRILYLALLLNILIFFWNRRKSRSTGDLNAIP